jgi:uncharacterized protein (DUF427 family)
MKSPGHEKNPNYKVRQEHPREKVEVFVNDKKIAESSNVIKVYEDTHPPRVYIPRQDLKIPLEKSSDIYDCPFKGHAQYYALNVGERKLNDAIWSYEQPYDEHMEIKDMVAFYSDKYPEIKVVERPL